jgi:Tfp pilus assembly protein PilF
MMDSNSLARDYLLIALKLDTLNVDIWIQLGIIYDKLNNIDSLEYCYQAALKINPQNALVNNNYAYSLSERGVKLDEALRMINIAIKAEPNNSAYQDTYGWIQFKLGNYESALDYILKAINTGEAGYEVFEHLGDVYKMMDKLEQAKEYYTKALQKNPNNKTTLEKLNSLK